MKYKKVLELISPTFEEKCRVEKTKNSLVGSLENSFKEDNGYSHTTVIGSAATENYLRGYRDIDVLILFNYFDPINFRKKIQGIRELQGIDFKGKKLTVEEKVNARYNNFDVSLGAVILDGSSKNKLGLDMEQHPTFTKKNLRVDQKPSILLSKQFFKNIGLYGEKLGGFTIEQLIYHYGEFEQLLQKIKTEENIYVDFSGKYLGNKTPIVVSYPFCGLDNLAKKVTEEDFNLSKEYAKKVLLDPDQFLEDTRRVMNKDFWSKRAIKYKDSEEFGFPDIHLNHRENKIMRKKIKPFEQKKILDVGCANGYSTIAISRPGNNFIWGIDANPNAIEMANRLRDKNGLAGLCFKVGEMSDIPFNKNYFDIIYAKRSLSNLPSRREQKKAIEEMSRVVKSEGEVYIFDLFVEGYEKLNCLRERFGLEKIELPFHCIPLKDDFIETALDNNLEISCEEDITSSYYLMSRIIYPKLLNFFGKQNKSDSFANFLFSNLPSFGEIGVNKLYTLRKK